jgi:hypothetical protein
VNLDIVGLIASLIANPLIIRDIRIALNAANQWHWTARKLKVESYPAELPKTWEMITNRVVETGCPHPVLGQPLEVDVGDYELLLV